jgi:hypothetical protein
VTVCRYYECDGVSVMQRAVAQRKAGFKSHGALNPALFLLTVNRIGRNVNIQQRYDSQRRFTVSIRRLVWRFGPFPHAKSMGRSGTLPHARTAKRLAFNAVISAR